MPIAFDKQVIARPSGRNVKDPDLPRHVRVRRYDDGWDVFVSILTPHSAQAQATVKLDPESALALTGLLKQAAAQGRAVQIEP